MERRGFFITLRRNAAFAWRLAAVVTLLAAAAVGGSNHVQARGSHHPAPPDPSHNPNYADIVVDDNSGQILHELNPDAPRHPASLTKIMTLYLLFEQLEAGVLKLDTPLPISAKAALQPPTKLHLKPNQTLTVEDAIGGMATRSANDAAVVVSEAIGGSEEDFAKLMTQKARELGMANTTYVNASGLPADEQITTARDQAILGHAIHDRFPTYYRYFSMISYRYHGVDIRNHNMLLGNVEGVDGIKTGYTEASGYNLVSSVHRSDKYIVAVVLGETSNSARDARMRALIEENIRLASTQRTLPIAASATALGQVDAKVNSAAPTPIKAAPELAGSSKLIENFEQ
ncbi:MAG TPA: D-alanyl-D-alanine carboxypeptidase family protein [Xanthobacteraceae bacterium]|jgi:D-alanyl-D-alanine carboxypeptidase